MAHDSFRLRDLRHPRRLRHGHSASLRSIRVADPPLAVDDSASIRRKQAGNDRCGGQRQRPGRQPGSRIGQHHLCHLLPTVSPANGSLANNGDGTFDYTPTPNFTGIDSFVYEICDLVGACDTAIGYHCRHPAPTTRRWLLMTVASTPENKT